MPVWQNALDISGIVFEMTIPLPKSEDYGKIILSLNLNLFMQNIFV